MEDSEHFNSESPQLSATSKAIAEAGISSDINKLSPISISRYGRTRKPKITEDFYDIDVIFESAKELKRSPKPLQTVKPVKPKLNHSPKKIKDGSTSAKLPSVKSQKFEHITGDLVEEEPVMSIPNNELNVNAIHNFFKSESGMSALHNASVSTEVTSKETVLPNEDVDVTQVLKIITTKTADAVVNSETKANSKPVLKTYSNKRKSYCKTSIVESFALPDTPIFPIENDKATPNEPKRIKNLDVAPPSSENEINLIDKKLLDTPWKIASMDAEIPNLDLLIDTTCDEYKEDVTEDLMSSPIKVVNETPSIFVETCREFDDPDVEIVDAKTRTESSPSRKSKRINQKSKAIVEDEDKEKIADSLGVNLNEVDEFVSQLKKPRKIESKSHRKVKSKQDNNFSSVEKVNVEMNLSQIDNNNEADSIESKSLKKQKENHRQNNHKNSEQVSTSVVEIITPSIEKEKCVTPKKNNKTRSPMKQKNMLLNSNVKDKSIITQSPSNECAVEELTLTVTPKREKKLNEGDTSFKTFSQKNEQLPNNSLHSKHNKKSKKVDVRKSEPIKSTLVGDDCKKENKVKDEKKSTRKLPTAITNTKKENEDEKLSTKLFLDAEKKLLMSSVKKFSRKPQSALSTTSDDLKKVNDDKKSEAVEVTHKEKKSPCKLPTVSNTTNVLIDKQPLPDKETVENTTNIKKFSLANEDLKNVMDEEKELMSLLFGTEKTETGENTGVVKKSSRNIPTANTKDEQKDVVESAPNVRKSSRNTPTVSSTRSDDLNKMSGDKDLSNNLSVDSDAKLETVENSAVARKTATASSTTTNNFKEVAQDEQPQPDEKKKLVDNTPIVRKSSRNTSIASSTKCDDLKKVTDNKQLSHSLLLDEDKETVAEDEQPSPDQKKKLVDNTPNVRKSSRNTPIASSTKCDDSKKVVDHKQSQSHSLSLDEDKVPVGEDEQPSTDEKKKFVDDISNVKKSSRNTPTASRTKSNDFKKVTDSVQSHSSLLDEDEEIAKRSRKIPTASSTTNKDVQPSTDPLPDEDAIGNTPSIRKSSRNTPTNKRLLPNNSILDENEKVVIVENASVGKKTSRKIQTASSLMIENFKKTPAKEQLSAEPSPEEQKEAVENTPIVKKSLRKIHTSSSVTENFKKGPNQEVSSEPASEEQKEAVETTPILKKGSRKIQTPLSMMTEHFKKVPKEEVSTEASREKQKEAAENSPIVKKSSRKKQTPSSTMTENFKNVSKEEVSTEPSLEEQKEAVENTPLVKKSSRKIEQKEAVENIPIVKKGSRKIQTPSSTMTKNFKKAPKEEVSTEPSLEEQKEAVENTPIEKKSSRRIQTPLNPVVKIIQKAPEEDHSTEPPPEEQKEAVENTSIEKKSSRKIQTPLNPVVKILKKAQEEDHSTEPSPKEQKEAVELTPNVKKSLRKIQTPLSTMVKHLKKAQEEDHSTGSSPDEQMGAVKTTPNVRKSSRLLPTSNNDLKMATEDEQLSFTMESSSTVRKSSRNTQTTVSRYVKKATESELSDEGQKSEPPDVIRKSPRKSIVKTATADKPSSSINEEKKLEPVDIRKSSRKIPIVSIMQSDLSKNEPEDQSDKRKKKSQLVKKIDCEDDDELSIIDAFKKSLKKPSKENKNLTEYENLVLNPKRSPRKLSKSYCKDESTQETVDTKKSLKLKTRIKSEDIIEQPSSDRCEITDVDVKKSTEFKKDNNESKQMKKSPRKLPSTETSPKATKRFTTLTRFRKSLKRAITFKTRTWSSVNKATSPRKLKPIVLIENSNIHLLPKRILVKSPNTSKRSERLSLKKQPDVDEILQTEDVTPLATSPVRSMSQKRKRSTSPQISHVETSSPCVSVVEVKRPRGRPRKSLPPSPNTAVVEKIDVLKKRISKSLENSREIKTEQMEDDETVDDVKIKTKEDDVSKPSTVTAKNKELRESEGSNLEITSMDIKKDPDDVNMGDLMWAKIGGHPYWPCLIVQEPNTQEYEKSYFSKNIWQQMYHVRFFGDKGRRSWVNSTSVIPFISKYDLMAQYEQSKNKTSFIVKPSTLPRWKVAVSEAESQLKCTIQQRLDFFTNFFIHKDTKAKKKPPEIQSLEVKKEVMDIYESEQQEPEIDISNLKKDRTRRSKSLPANSPTQSSKNQTKKDKDLEIIEKDSIADINPELISDLDKEIDNSSVKSKETSENCDSAVEESTETFLKMQWKPFPAIEKNLDGNSECSFSDTDSVSKSSSSTPVPCSFQQQVMRQKRNNLFRGVAKARVCQVCKLPNEVFKCKGPCNGLYHYRCANYKSKTDVETPDEGPSNGLPDSTQNIPINLDDPDCSQMKNDDVGEIPPSNSHLDDTPKVDFSQLSIAEQIDIKMKEVMQDMENVTRYADSTTDYSSSEESIGNLLTEKEEEPPHCSLLVKHVTADHISFISNDGSDDLISGTSQKVNLPFENDQNDCKKEDVIVGDGSKDLINREINLPMQNACKKDIVADIGTESDTNSTKVFQCGYCLSEVEPPCFACGKDVSSKNESLRQKCSLHACGKFYHPKCLKVWPQTQWSLISMEKHKDSDELLDTFVCPVHVCHTCVSDDPHGAVSRCGSRKVVKCLHCPATYHTTNYCIPAGTQILSTSQIICPRHFIKDIFKKGKIVTRTINTPWCFICSKGGDLICCETCPTSVHTDCLTVNFTDDETFICEDCETGRFPLYDEIVWVKLGNYRWWPAAILFPSEVPSNVKSLPHNGGEFVVKFFGTHDHYWVGRGRVFLFQEGDKGHCSPSKKRVDALFKKSIEEATAAHTIKKIFRKSKEAEIKTVTKPPPYIRVKVNKPVGNVRLYDANISNTTSCECNPCQEYPCGPESDCINRLLLTECDPNICPAKDKCNNQRFEKRQYPPLVPYKTQGRGWGLKALSSISKGDFVIEYVGEIIDEHEYQRRIRKMHEQKDENYYFLTIDKDRIIDAGPKGNLARFMNHCCQPNCETQKWTVNGDTRVGLFAIENIPAESELTFNYNLECIGKEKKICKCGAPKCSGFIGVKVKDESQKRLKKSNVIKKKIVVTSHSSKNNVPCFVCGKNGDVGACYNKICTKVYHLQCVNLEAWPEGKWVCPWHNCNVCTKRTIRCCVKCTNSYCPVHSEGSIRYDKLLGFVCSEHDNTKEATNDIQRVSPVVKNFKSSELTTDETDVTSTTGDNYDNAQISNESPTTELSQLITSTPIKNSQLVLPLAEFENDLVKDNLQIPQSSIPESKDNQSLVSVKIGKRKKGRPKKEESTKRIKLSDSLVKSKSNFSTSNLMDLPIQNEVKLCSSVPTRHLRTTRSHTPKIVNKRFLRQQNELEKDLPIRKRSRPRCEVTL